jgi:hypothetical protein
MAKKLFDHIVVVMLENRPFDHFFSHLDVGDGLANVDAVNTSSRVTRTPWRPRPVGVATSSPSDKSVAQLKETNKQPFWTTKVAADEASGHAKMGGFVTSFKTALTHDLQDDGVRERPPSGFRSTLAQRSGRRSTGPRASSARASVTTGTLCSCRSMRMACRCLS